METDTFFKKKKELRRELCTCYELTVHIIHMTLVSAKRNVAIRAKKNPTNHLATRLGDIRDVTARWRYDWSISAWFICHCVAELWTLAANRIKFLFVFFFLLWQTNIIYTHTHRYININIYKYKYIYRYIYKKEREEKNKKIFKFESVFLFFENGAPQATWSRAH